MVGITLILKGDMEMEDKEYKFDTSDMVDAVKEEEETKRFKRGSILLGAVIMSGFVALICLHIAMAVQP